MNELLGLSSDYGLISLYHCHVSLHLLVFHVGAATKVSYTEWVSDVNWEYPSGWDGAVKGFSFAFWIHLGIEELPLAIEMTINPERNVPSGLVTSISTLAVLAFCTVICNSMIYPGAEENYNSSSPLLTGYIFGDSRTTSAFLRGCSRWVQLRASTSLCFAWVSTCTL
ncbi:unnamed protein product [Peronospora effusa]|nr:unnamed protein product [Peronospora effusa]